MSDNPIITAVIPVRLSTDRLYDEPERIARIVATLPGGYVPLIVDYGTSGERAGELRDLATATGTRLIRVETGGEPFSVGHARDIGTRHANTPLILYHDIDFLMSPRSYERVLEEARLRGMPGNAYTFFALPGAYLTEDFTRRYLDLFARGEGAFADGLLHDGVMRADRSVYQNHTYAISAIVASRYHLLAIGGHDDGFVGHGAEDFELLHRLASYAPRGPRTGSYYLNTRRNAILRYEGFRAYFALYGIDVFQRGLQMAHLWHPQRQDTSYVAPMEENQARVSRIMADYDAGSSWLYPMEDPHAREHTLVLAADEAATAVRGLRHAFPAFGRYRIRPEADFTDSGELIRVMDAEGFTRVLFSEPRGDAHRRSLYEGVRAAGRRVVVWGRGGLPDSWFFDPRGLPAEGTSYAPELWDRPLDATGRQKTIDRLAAFRDGQAPADGDGRTALRERLGVNGRQVVLVAPQEPDDGAAPTGAGGFHEWVAHLAQALDPDAYAVLAQRPAGVTGPEIAGVGFVGDDIPAADLIDLAASVVVQNDDLGLIALSLGKPVVCCGAAFYARPGLARSASSVEELVAAVRLAAAPDDDKRLRFFHYLIEDFYSFGTTEQGARSNGSDPVPRILFSVIRGLADVPIDLGTPPVPVSLKAPLFFSFGGREAVQEETTSINALIRMGNAACERGGHAEAIHLFEVANRRQPHNRNLCRAMTEAGKALHAAGHHEAAIRLFDMAQVWFPEDRGLFRVLVETAKAAHAAGDHAAAARLFDTAQAWFPGDKGLFRALIDTAKAAHAVGDHTAAVRLFDMAQVWFPEDRGLFRALVETAKAAHAAGDHAAAVRLFDTAQAWFPGDKGLFRVLVETAKAAHAAGDHAAAGRLFDMAQVWFPEDGSLPRLLIGMGKAARAGGHYGEAVRLFERAHAGAPDDGNLRRLLLETGVQRHGGPLVDMMVTPSAKLGERARQAFANADYKQATRLFEVLRMREPDEVEHLRCLAECYLKSGAGRLALDCLEEALRRLPGNRRLMRRRRDAKLPQWLRRLFPGKPFLT